MKPIQLGIILLVLATLLAIPIQAVNLPITVDRVEIDDIELFSNQVNRLDVQRNTQYDLEIRFTPQQRIRNLQFQAFVSGFEFSDIAPIDHTSTVFDVDENITYVRRFRLHLSDQVDEDDYKIRIIFSDRGNNELVTNYNIKIDVPRHQLKVEDVVFYPAGTVRAGEALLSTVRLENQGEKIERDVKVEVSIPQLRITGTDYIDEIKNSGNREKGTEEIFMRLPDCATPGEYDVVIKVWYNQLHDISSSKSTIKVLENPNCNAQGQVNPLGTRTLSAPIVIIKDMQTNDLSNENMPGDTARNKGNTNATETSEDAESGSSSWFTVPSLRRALEFVLLLLVALLIVVALVLGFRSLRKEDEEPQGPSQKLY